MRKTSIRFYNGFKVRAVYDEEHNEWMFSATDLITILTNTNNSRIYWNTLKTRNPKLYTFCRQLKLTSKDGKSYLQDVLNEEGIKKLLFVLPNKNNENIKKWLEGKMDPLDEQSKRKAYEIFEGDILSNIEVGTFRGLQQIHSHLFGGLYEFSGKIRNKNISKGGFIFANCNHLEEILRKIDDMKDNTLEEILDKYIEMNIAHPFMEGNGRATRIWLDLLLKSRLNLCVDWSKINKKDYLISMEKSPLNSSYIFNLISSSLTNDIESRELFMKGIDYSYYYEEVE